MQVNETVVEVVKGSVIDQDVDAIVNAANTGMRGGGGIDGAIHRAAGKALMEELIDAAPHGAKTGTVVVTSGYNLKQKYVLHTPGPRWRDGNHDEPALLASCYRSCLEAADKLKLASIGYCSIATGVYGYPIDEAAKVAVGTVVSYLKEHPDTTVKRVVFAMWQEEEYEVFARHLSAL